MFENDDSGIAVKKCVQLANGFTILQFRPSFLPISTSLIPPASITDYSASAQPMMWCMKPMDKTLSLIESGVELTNHRGAANPIGNILDYKYYP
jgi:hypothetical protein